MKKMGTRKQKEILKSSTSYTSSTPSLVPTSSSVINLSQKALSTISHAFVYLFIFLLIFWGILLCGILLTSSLSPYDQAPRMVPFNSPTALEVADHFSGGNLEDKTFIVTGFLFYSVLFVLSYSLLIRVTWGRGNVGNWI